MSEIIELPLIEIIGRTELQLLLSSLNWSYSQLFFNQNISDFNTVSNFYCGIGIVEYEGGNFLAFTGVALYKGKSILFEDVSINIESLFSISEEKLAISDF